MVKHGPEICHLELKRLKYDFDKCERTNSICYPQASHSFQRHCNNGDSTNLVGLDQTFFLSGIILEMNVTLTHTWNGSVRRCAHKSVYSRRPWLLWLSCPRKRAHTLPSWSKVILGMLYTCSQCFGGSWRLLQRNFPLYSEGTAILVYCFVLRQFWYFV